MMGINDISCKVFGSRNSINVIEAFFEVLRRQKTPEEVAVDSGMKVEDVLKIYEYGMRLANEASLGNVSHEPQ